MIKTNFSGRTGNILLQNIGTSILSKKFNLKAEYKFINKSDLLGVNLSDGERIITDLVNQYDIKHTHVEMGKYGTLMDLLNRDDVEYGLYYDGTFQVKEFVIEYKDVILSHFNLKYDESYSKDLFIHIRLGDVAHLNPGIEYYRKSINMLSVNRIYLSTDNEQHKIVQTLISEYNIILYKQYEIATINFAKNFGNLILSKGTFSWWIGVLSKAKNILYPIGDVTWYGDIFVYDDWIPVQI